MFEFFFFFILIGGFGLGLGWGLIDENFMLLLLGYLRVIKLVERRVLIIIIGMVVVRVLECI